MNKSNVCNTLCILLMGLLLVLQFVPFWSYDGGSTSIQSYVWLETDRVPLEAYFVSHLGSEYSINSTVLMPIIVLVATVAGIALCVSSYDNIFAGLLPLACGIAGTWGYLTEGAFRLGTSWVLHLLVCIAMIAAAALRTYFLAKDE